MLDNDPILLRNEGKRELPSPGDGFLWHCLCQSGTYLVHHVNVRPRSLNPRRRRHVAVHEGSDAMSDQAKPAAPAPAAATAAAPAAPKPVMPAKPAPPPKKGEDRRNFIVRFVTSPIAVAWTAFSATMAAWVLGSTR